MKGFVPTLAPVVDLTVENLFRENPSSLPRHDPPGIDIDSEYDRMLSNMCSTNTAHWHL